MASNNGGTLGHFLARLAGLTGLVVAVTGLIVWLETDDSLGLILTCIGLGAFLVGAAVEIAARVGAALSSRGAVGGNVLAQLLLAALLLVGINVFSFNHYFRCDWTEKGEFTLKKTLQEELSKLRGETITIVVLQKHSVFGQQGTQDHYDAAAERKIVEKVRDLVEQIQEQGPRFKIETLDIDNENFQDKLSALKDTSKGGSAALGAAIENAPENSIFFFTKADSDRGRAEHIQRLSFQHIYQLDKQASQQAGVGKGNLVLKYQGAGPFTNKILHIEEKRPRIAVAAVYESDGLESTSEWGLRGVKKALAQHGFDSRDLILKRGQFGVLTYEESNHERLVARIEEADDTLDELERLRKTLAADKADFQEPLARVNKKYAMVRRLRPVPVEGGLVRLEVFERPIERVNLDPRDKERDLTDNDRTRWLDLLTSELEELEFEQQSWRERRKKLVQDKEALNAEELAEKRRIADVKAKMDRVLADCDLVLLPRLTLVNVAESQNFNYDAYRLDDAHVEALKGFIRAAKPVLFCLSPPRDEKDGLAPRDDKAGLGRPREKTDLGLDSVDKLLAELRIRLGRETVFYTVDSEALAERRANPDSRIQLEPPPIEVDWPKGAGLLKDQLKFATGIKHPLRSSLRLGSRLSAKQPFDLRLRHPRPVYVVRYSWSLEGLPAEIVAGLAGDAGALPFHAVATVAARAKEAIDEQAVFLLSGGDSWNETKPLPSDGRIPRFKRPKADDPSKGTLQEKRRGPFPIAVALETRPPASWYGDEKNPLRPKVRLAVIGHGGAFLGDPLSPAKEKLLLDTCNWLLGRDDLLAKDTPISSSPSPGEERESDIETWQFPRVALSSTESALWTWGTRLGLPLLFAYFGLVMLLVRRMR